MQYLIYLSAVLIVITKLVDALSTLRFVKKGNIDLEQNKLARMIMYKIGVKTTIWLVFFITIIIVTVVVREVLQSGLWWYEWSFVITAAFVSFVQGSVAYFNYTGKKSTIIMYLTKWTVYK